MLEALQDFITTSIGEYGLLAIFVLMVLESACIPIPSEVTMLFGGAMTSTAFAGAGNELDFWAVVAAGTLGNLLGSWLAYGVGDKGGRPMIDRFGRYLLIRPHEVDRAHAWFEQHGEVTVFVSRLLPVVRTFISLPAGVARMPLLRFSVLTVLGTLPWCIMLVAIGDVAGTHWDEWHRRFGYLDYVVVAAAIAVVAWLVLRQRREAGQ